MKEKKNKKSFSDKELAKLKPIADKVMALESKYASMTDEKLHNMTKTFKILLAEGKNLDDILPDAYAVVREAAWRLLGKKPYYVQILGAIALHKGLISEMHTGEGKTLTETMPVYLNALTGNGVHVVTVNDYLAKRDSEEMGKIYNFLELSVGLISQDIKDIYLKQKAYNCDITYGTNNEFGFDYLRDNMAPNTQFLVQRGHNYAIVDEVDSILIDEARTPLIISGHDDQNTAIYKSVADLVRTMTSISVIETESGSLEYEDSEADYVVHEKKKIVTLTPHGIKQVEGHFNIENLTSPENAFLFHLVNQSIKAFGIMTKNKDYVVKDGEVMIVDEFTGRIMKGRQFNEGLHQAIQAKEKIEVTSESKTYASVTYQNYFRMYGKLAGMTGTAATEKDEFKEIYNLDVVCIPENKPRQRIDNEDIVFLTEDQKYDAIVNKIIEVHKKGQPILIGTPSVEKSELVAKKLREKSNMKFNVLNAKNHELEASIIAQAGRIGAVTISTNMAGRGTDIALGGNPEFMTKDSMKRDAYCSRIIKKYSGLIQLNSESENAMEHIEAQMIEQADSFHTSDNPLIREAQRQYKSLLKNYKMICDAEKEAVEKRGGLFVIGCERHESRRIDNQLIGRSGRQGDPGESQFYLSLEDDLMRLFGGDKIANVVKQMDGDNSNIIPSSLVRKNIVVAQKNVESIHFEQRKQVFDYDMVVNEQRLCIYRERRLIMDSQDIEKLYQNLLKASLTKNFEKYFIKKQFNYDKFKELYSDSLCDDKFPFTSKDSFSNYKSKDVIVENLVGYIMEFMRLKKDEIGETAYKTGLQSVLLKILDNYWRKHLSDIEQLKKGIYLMGYGQKDPKTEFKAKAYEIYDQMLNNIRDTYLTQSFSMKKREIFHVK